MADSALLRWLEYTHAFDPVPIPGFRTSLYVPFEQLTEKPCESRVARAVVSSQRTAVIGPVGCGKSSLVEYVLATERATSLAPLWVSAAHEGDETLVDPVEFARHMIRQIVRWADQVGAMTSEDVVATRAESASTYARATRMRADTIGLRLALKWIEPRWSREVAQTLADPKVTRSRTDFVDSLDRLVELI